MEDDRSTVMKVEGVVCVRNQGGKQMLISMWADLLVCMVGRVVVGVVFFGEHSFPVTEVMECLGVNF